MRPFPAVRTVLAAASLLALARPAGAIERNPNGVNVASQGATTVFITFGDLSDQVPVEAVWCGELISAAPDVGMRCDPATIFGRLPIRFDQSALSADRRAFTDIMSIPPSVARRAYQAAARGENSAFFYVRRFISLAGGPDEYVFVTCRMAGGGARVPLALLDVELAWEGDETVLPVERGTATPPLSARISYNGTGRLKGRWEVVLPGEEPPDSRDLLTEATLPPDQRPLQRRYTQLARFNVFLPPTGHVTLPGPDPARIPTVVDGLYQILLRVEASDDKEADSDLAAAGAGTGVVHAGAVAGFPMPVLRYFVGSVPTDLRLAPGLALLAPAPDATLPAGSPLQFSWSLAAGALVYRLEIADADGGPLHAALLQQGIGSYGAPSWLRERVPAGAIRWRVVALGAEGEEIGATPWRRAVMP